MFVSDMVVYNAVAKGAGGVVVEVAIVEGAGEGVEVAEGESQQM